MTTCISVSHQGLKLNWNIDDETEAQRVATEIIAIINGQKTTKRRRRFTPEQLQEIANAYHAAPEGGTNKAVRDLLGVSRQDATNYISRCRIKGLIGPADFTLRGGITPRHRRASPPRSTRCWPPTRSASPYIPLPGDLHQSFAAAVV